MQSTGAIQMLQFQIWLSTIYYIFHERLIIQTLMKYILSQCINLICESNIKTAIIFNSTFSFYYHVELINHLISYGCIMFIAMFVYDSLTL